MSGSLQNSDSSDSDVFVLKQIKPINKLTLQQALIIKHRVLMSFQSKSDSGSNKSSKKKKDENTDKHEKSKKSKKKKRDKSTASAKKTKKDVSNKANGNWTGKIETLDCEDSEILNQDFVKDIKTESPEIIMEDTNAKKVVSPSKITNYFSSSEVTPEKQKRQIDEDENIQVSPGISRKRKKFKMFKNTSPNSSKFNHCVRKTFDESASQVNEKKLTSTFSNNDFICQVDNGFENEEKPKDFKESQIKDSIDVINFCKKEEEEEEEKYRDNSELNCFLFKKIIQDETKKQIKLEENTFKSGKYVEKLLSEKDCEVLERFFNLDENTCKVYVRMLCRKKGWYRVSTISYKDINGDLQREFKLLSAGNFVDFNIEQEDLKTQMDLLRKPEIQQLCRAFNVKTKLNKPNKKNELIRFLIEDCKNQKSVLEMMQNRRGSRVDLLRSQVKIILGMCLKLNEAARSTFRKIMILFSFAHYQNEERKRFSDQLFLCMKVFKKMIRFPNYKLSPTVVFETKYDFEQYGEALSLYECFENAIIMKNHEDFTFIANKAKEEFYKLLNDNEYQKRFMNLESFLKKFSAGAIYARILTKYCDLFKRKSDNKEIISITQTLLDQNLFLLSKRGKWYELLSQAYKTLKESDAAAEVLIRSLNDPCIDEVQKLTLQLRGQALLKMKTNCIKQAILKEILDDLCTISVQEPASIEIKGEVLQGNETGYKCVYIEENENGKLYTSVEEKAILYYKSNGFTNGYHSEGFLVQSIYFLIFFNIIYEPSPPGVFQSPYQEAPLDFYSKSFYLNRKEAIDSLLNEMCGWTEEEVKMKLNAVYYENFNVSSVITWREHCTPELFCEIIKCITMPALTLICQRFVRNFRIARSGFPDLTLWNSETKKCKFVEVKSPNDKLSPAQRVWLDYLRNIGIDCEVCNVKNMSSKSF